MLLLSRPIVLQLCQVRTAWKVAQRSGIVRQIFNCRFGVNGRAFAVGVVIARANNNYQQRYKPTTDKYETRMSCSKLYLCSSIIVVSAVAAMLLCGFSLCGVIWW